jgi:hypothetical protein
MPAYDIVLGFCKKKGIPPILAEPFGHFSSLLGFLMGA